MPGVFRLCKAGCQRLKETKREGREDWEVACVSGGDQYGMGRMREL